MDYLESYNKCLERSQDKIDNFWNTELYFGIRSFYRNFIKEYTVDIIDSDYTRKFFDFIKNSNGFQDQIVLYNNSKYIVTYKQRRNFVLGFWGFLTLNRLFFRKQLKPIRTLSTYLLFSSLFCRELLNLKMYKISI
jgi:hypothetical protein